VANLTLQALRVVAEGGNQEAVAKALKIPFRTAADYVRRAKEYLEAQANAYAAVAGETPDQARTRTIARMEALAAALTDERARVQLEIKLAEIRGVLGPSAPTTAVQVNVTQPAAAGYSPLPALPGLSPETRKLLLAELETPATEGEPE
jgi:hypothetical protein